ncbi:hypothetical protein Ancab_020878 [Ancistrocladus abbreviatus]
MGARQSREQRQDSEKEPSISAGELIAGIAVAGAGLIIWGLFSSSGGSGRGKKMKAPGREGFIYRADFERDPAAYFRDLHGNLTERREAHL